MGRLLFLIVNVVSHIPGTCPKETTYWTDGLVSYSGSLFLSLAGLMNIFIWLYFILSVKSYIPTNKLLKRRWLKIVNLSFIPVSLVIPSLYGVGLIWGCALHKQNHTEEEDSHDPYKPVQRYIFIVGSIIFMVLGVGFLITGKWLRREIKSYNEDLELKLRGRLIYATYILSIPFIIRWAYNLIGAIIHIDAEVMQPSIIDDTWTAPIVYFFYIIIADLLPITSQLISMVVVVSDVNNDDMISSTIDKRSDTTEDNLSLLNDEDQVDKIQISTGTRYTSSGYYRELSGKFITITSQAKEEDN